MNLYEGYALNMTEVSMGTPYFMPIGNSYWLVEVRRNNGLLGSWGVLLHTWLVNPQVTRTEIGNWFVYPLYEVYDFLRRVI